MRRGHLVALSEAFLVTFLWSSSYVLVKIGLTQVSPLTLAALRYITASAIMVPAALLRGTRKDLSGARTLLKLVFLGVSGYALAQGLQCVGLFYLPAVSVTFILNFTPVIVLVLGVVLLREYPTKLQLAGMALVMLGAYLFFNAPLQAGSLAGVLVTLVSGLGWATYLVSCRHMFVSEDVNPLGLTAFPMGFGTLIIAAAAHYVEGVSWVSPSSWTIVLWLGVVNTALAFFLWNLALRRLEAFEIAILQNTMLVQIAILSWLFLGEQLTTAKIVSMALVFGGVLLVQLRNITTEASSTDAGAASSSPESKAGS